MPPEIESESETTASELAVPPEIESETDDDIGYGDLGMQLRLLGDQAVVTSLEPGGPAAEAGIQQGWAVIRIGELDVVEFAERIAKWMPDERARGTRVSRVINSGLEGKHGRRVALRLLDDADQEVEIEAERRAPPREPVAFGNLPPIVVHSRVERLADERVGYLWFDGFLMPAPQLFSEAMVGFIDDGVDGVIIDLRGNPGGLVGMVRGMAGHLVGEKTSLGQMVYRDAQYGRVELELRVNPRPAAQRFDGPVAVLVDWVTVSTGEVFAAGLQGIGRATVFGVRTPGMAMPSILERLPNGDTLQLPVGDSLDPRGNRLEKDGVVPDVELDLTRDDYRGGRDPVIEAALAWIESESVVEQPSEGDAPDSNEETP